MNKIEIYFDKTVNFLKNKDFRYKSFSIPLVTPTSAPEILISLIHKHFNRVHSTGVLYRTAGITLHELVPTHASQMDLFGSTEKSNKFEIYLPIVKNKG